MATPGFVKRMTIACKPELKDKRNWNFVFQYLQKNMKAVHHPLLLEIVCKFLLNNLIKYGCNEFTVALRVIEIYSRWLPVEDRHYTPFTDRKKSVLRPVYRFDAEKDLTRGDTMMAAVDAADVRLATAVVKFGCLYCVPPCSCRSGGVRVGLEAYYTHSVCEAFRVIKILPEFCSRSYVPKTKFKSLSPTTDLVHLLQTEQGKMLSENQRGFRRIYFIVLMLRPVMLKMDNDPSVSNCVECLKLFFKSHPEPYVSKEEMQEFLNFIFQNDEDTDIVEKSVDIYVDLFRRESAVPYCPRPLKDLCRFTVRNILCKRKSGILPNLINSLPLPVPLKDFIIIVPDPVL